MRGQDVEKARPLRLCQCSSLILSLVHATLGVRVPGAETGRRKISENLWHGTIVAREVGAKGEFRTTDRPWAVVAPLPPSHRTGTWRDRLPAGFA